MTVDFGGTFVTEAAAGKKFPAWVSCAERKMKAISTAFRQELKKLGYVEGENIDLEYRSGKTDQLPKLAAELVDLQVVIILADGSGPAGVAKQATSKIPIVMTTSSRSCVDRTYRQPCAARWKRHGIDRPIAENLGGKNLALLKETRAETYPSDYADTGEFSG